MMRDAILDSSDIVYINSLVVDDPQCLTQLYIRGFTLVVCERSACVKGGGDRRPWAMSRDPKVHKGRAQRALTLPPAWEEEAVRLLRDRPRLLLDWVSIHIYGRFQKRRPPVERWERSWERKNKKRALFYLSPFLRKPAHLNLISLELVHISGLDYTLQEKENVPNFNFPHNSIIYHREFTVLTKIYFG